MTKPVLAGVFAVALIAIGASIYVVSNNKDQSTQEQAADGTQQNSDTSTDTKLNDPDGVYTLFSDPSVTKYPQENFVFGNGQEMTFEYDGSKTGFDEYATLTYELYYIQDDGSVAPMTNGNLEGKGSGTFKTTDKVFRSEVDGKKGFVGLVGTYDTGLDDNGAIKGTNVKLGMYSVVYEVSE